MSKYDPDQATITKNKEEVTEPPKYKVILHNDDFTPMDFVTLVLEKVFRYSYRQAESLMLKVHYSGSGIVGIYPYEIAELKLVKATRWHKKKVIL
ncbi:MAG: ATP-dependent Clp protease adaptor ClpS [Blastocatellia bacterium]|nr:ATP-dependent Clp protease adaptor ClpS [Blastocatellia bacterium]